MMLSMPPVPADWARHTPYSDPGSQAALLDVLEPTDRGTGAVVRNLIGHYRAEADQLSPQTQDEVNLRWVAEMLGRDQDRHGAAALTDPRPLASRLQGCCRDHTLLAVSILRQHGVPARSRVGFASYFVPGWHHDHVIVELHDGDRWRRVDPEVAPDSGMLPDPLDIPAGPDSPFLTAAEAFRAVRAGELDPESFGVAPGHPLHGEGFVLAELFWELAHRYGDELLLWDDWGAIPGPEEEMDAALLALLDEVAALLIAADAGDTDAETRLHSLYTSDDRLHPGETVRSFSPVGDGMAEVDLRR